MNLSPQVLLYFGVFVLSLVNGVLLIAALLGRKHSTVPNRLLSVVILFFLYNNFIAVLDLSQSPYFEYLDRRSVFFLVFLAIPSLYFYVVSMTTPLFRFRDVDKLHLIPLVLAGLWYLAFTILAFPSPFPAWKWEFYALQWISLLVFTLYLAASIRVLRDYRRMIKEYVSDTHQVQLTWLEFFLWLFIPLWTVRFLDVVVGPNIQLWMWIPPLSTAAILAMGLFALRQSVVFLPREESVVRERRVSLSEKEIIEGKARLQQFLAEGKHYLDPDLRLRALSEAVDMRPQLVSEVIHRGFQANFYELINTYRIEEAKRRLLDPTFAHMNILGVAVDCGFKSKSVFNDAFKRMTGLTPSEFRSSGWKGSPLSPRMSD